MFAEWSGFAILDTLSRRLICEPTFGGFAEHWLGGFFKTNNDTAARVAASS
jgi:hypothetical protein